MTNPLQALETLADNGMQPLRREVWLVIAAAEALRII
jgi:hypothetical protein